jgi:hypothetical protein
VAVSIYATLTHARTQHTHPITLCRPVACTQPTHARQRDNRDKLSPACSEAVFRQQLEAEDDIRLSVRLFQKCLADKRQFCDNVPPTHSAARDCLIHHRYKAGFSAPCRCARVPASVCVCVCASVCGVVSAVGACVVLRHLLS